MDCRCLPGTVLAAQLCDDGSAGYASDAARRLAGRLRALGVYTRPLGDVVYLMVAPTTDRGTCQQLLAALLMALEGN
jgi:bifunctional dethiobiotin synthetase / adenosylmethionine---8-amino-7-oxononanoate aminotransferase